MHKAMTRGLIVEDNQDVAEDVVDILDSLGHQSDHAVSMASARCLLDSGEYDYVLLDLEIPAREGRGIPRLQNGENLLREIRAHPTHGKVPVIIMTAHGNEGPAQGVRMMKNGATDYIAKPFPTSGQTLDIVIQEALANKASAAQQKAPTEPDKRTPPRRAPSCAMVFYPSHVELAGVKICAESNSTLIRKILDALKAKRPDGKRTSISGSKLAKMTGSDGGQNTITHSIRRFRLEMEELFPGGGPLPCSPKEVILTKGSGYCINEAIAIR